MDTNGTPDWEAPWNMNINHPFWTGFVLFFSAIFACSFTPIVQMLFVSSPTYQGFWCHLYVSGMTHCLSLKRVASHLRFRNLNCSYAATKTPACLVLLKNIQHLPFDLLTFHLLDIENTLPRHHLLISVFTSLSLLLDKRSIFIDPPIR